jgi:hypothetical protein
VAGVTMLEIQLKRVYNRTLREISNLGFLKQRSEAAYRTSVENFANQLPSLTPIDRPIVDLLEQRGIFITTLSELKLQQTDALLHGVNCILPELSTLSNCRSGEFLIKASSEQLLQHPSIFLWGLEERLLNIVENYLKLPVAYHGVYFRKDLANEVITRTRRWHLDKEDRRMLKIIIYLNNVDEKGGCFQYISDDYTLSIIQRLKYNYGKITNTMMKQVVPPSLWFSCIGPAGTVIIFDPARIFHRGKVPTKSDRYTLFFDYTSRVPQRPYYCKSSFTVHELLTLTDQLSNHQIDCIFWSRELAKINSEMEVNRHSFNSKN